MMFEDLWKTRHQQRSRREVEKVQRRVALIHHSSPKNHITVTIRSDNADELKDKIAAVIEKENRRRKNKITYEIFYIS
jgi:hypothetical protein